MAAARWPSAPYRPASISNSSRGSIGFTWQGFDETDEVRGEGSGELLDDGSIEIEFEDIETATKPSSKRNATLPSTACRSRHRWEYLLFQLVSYLALRTRPASSQGDWPHE